MGPLTGTYDAWDLCRHIKLVIKFLNGTCDAKIQSPVLVTYINFYFGTCDVY